MNETLLVPFNQINKKKTKRERNFVDFQICNQLFMTQKYSGKKKRTKQIKTKKKKKKDKTKIYEEKYIWPITDDDSQLSFKLSLGDDKCQEVDCHHSRIVERKKKSKKKKENNKE